MWSLWCIADMVGTLLLGQTAVLIHRKGRTLSHNSVKQTIDMLPNAICYFHPIRVSSNCAIYKCTACSTYWRKAISSTSMNCGRHLECDKKSGVVRLPDEEQTYLFPDGKAWRYSQTEITVPDGTVYTEAIFSDVTELYERD